MSDAIPSVILANTFAVSDLYRRADLLQRFFEYLFFDANAPHGNRAELIRQYYREADPETVAHVGAIAQWGDEIFEGFASETLYQRIRDLKEAVRSVPKISLYVPVRLPHEEVARLGKWCRTHLEQGILLDLRTDPTVVGGCAFAYNNVFHDLSLSYFGAKERQRLVELIRSYEQ